MAVPRGRLNQAAASSVCSVIVGRADQVVSEEKQAGMWLAESRGGEGKGRGVLGGMQRWFNGAWMHTAVGRAESVKTRSHPVCCPSDSGSSSSEVSTSTQWTDSRTDG